MKFCSDICLLLFCCIQPLFVVIGCISLLSREKSIPTQCTLLSKEESTILISGKYFTGAQGATNDCGPTINKINVYQVYVPSYNMTTILCGSSSAKVNCCSKEECHIINKDFSETCPPLIMESQISINTTFTCYYLNDVVKITDNTAPSWVLYAMLIVFGTWLLIVVVSIVISIRKSLYDTYISLN